MPKLTVLISPRLISGICIAVMLLGFLPQSAFAFGPCIAKMPAGVSYLPRLPLCGGKAAVVVTGRFLNSFSIVVRDCENGDRDPCHRQIGSCGTNASSPFKVQKLVSAKVSQEGVEGQKIAKIHCLKEAGDSQVFKLVRRITIKLRNPASNPQDIVRLCLPSRTRARNKVTVEKVLGQRAISDGLGYLPICRTQGYLDCSAARTGNCNLLISHPVHPTPDYPPIY